MNRVFGALSIMAALGGLASCSTDKVVLASTPAQPRESRRQPFQLDVRGQRVGSRTLLDLVVAVDERLPGNPDIRFHLPPGASLEDGRTLPALKASDRPGRQSRRFALRDVDGPVLVTADLSGPGYGYHAEAQWPPSAVTPAVLPAEVDIPPTRLHGVLIQRAVPLDAVPEAPVP